MMSMRSFEKIKSPPADSSQSQRRVSKGKYSSMSLAILVFLL